MERVYIAATEQHAGKTTICLGLFKAAVDRGLRACFVKPVGQRYVVEDGERVDEDAWLFKRVYDTDGELPELSPITIPRGFTREYIFSPNPDAIHGRILKAVERLEPGHDVAIVEGTGHAGVGSVLDASNARVAQLLGAHVLIASGGGIGRCIDEICLNEALFRHHNAPLIGAVINKVYTEKMDKVAPAVRQGLANQGIQCVGVIPYLEELSWPTMRQLLDGLDQELLCGEQWLNRTVKSIIVAAMAPQNMINYIGDGSLVVVPGDRVDNVIASVSAQLMTNRHGRAPIAGLMLTGGFTPHETIVEMLSQVDVPVIMTPSDTATAAYRARRFVPKITPRDERKVGLAQQMVAEHVDIDGVFRAAGLA